MEKRSFIAALGRRRLRCCRCSNCTSKTFPLLQRDLGKRSKFGGLDDCARELAIEDAILLKLDVQGAEDKVIGGGKELIRRAKVLIIETSMESLYEGQALFGDIFEAAPGLGFRYKGALSQAFSPLDGSVLYADSIFIREA